jgi:putative SOS response-associated peptidase YedK
MLCQSQAHTVATKPTFRSAFKKRRCLVLADGYYEWHTEGKRKQPFLFEVDGGKPFALAGLWEWWRDPATPDGPALESCALITTDPNEVGAKVHDRMPVILDERHFDTWLDPTNDDTAKLQKLLATFPAKRMTARQVSTYVSNSRNEGPDCLNPPA